MVKTDEEGIQAGNRNQLHPIRVVGTLKGLPQAGSNQSSWEMEFDWFVNQLLRWGYHPQQGTWPRDLKRPSSTLFLQNNLHFYTPKESQSTLHTLSCYASHTLVGTAPHPHSTVELPGLVQVSLLELGARTRSDSQSSHHHPALLCSLRSWARLMLLETVRRVPGSTRGCFARSRKYQFWMLF